MWASTGVVTVETSGGTWVLPPVRALWIPAGVPHATAAHGSAVMHSPYLLPGTCPVDWREPTVDGRSASRPPGISRGLRVPS